MYFRINRFTIFFFLIIVLSSCSLLETEKPTFSVKSIKVINGTSSTYDVGALIVVLQNYDEREISSIVFDFDVYDIDGRQQPQIGKNHIDSSLEIQIQSDNENTVTVVLDSLFSLPPSETLTVTRFCITQINYSNGSDWRDELRQYQIMATEIEVETAEDLL